MDNDRFKQILHDNLRAQRSALFDKLDGVGERAARMPAVPTGTNLLGLVKHCAAVELGYFGLVFDRPSELPFPDDDGPDADNADMYAAQDESMADVLDYARACFAHADDTIDALELDTPGAVPWWPEARRQVTLGQVIVHVALDEARHAGHADILREQLDGLTGWRGPGDNLPDWEPTAWSAYVDKLRRIADSYPA